MTCTIEWTPVAQKQVDSLTKAQGKPFWAWHDDLEHRGCAAMDYRLSGGMFSSVCSRHLLGRWRALVAFPSPAQGRLLLVGEHKDGDPDNVYATLYEMAGQVPPSDAGRRQPPCCDPATGLPPDPDEDLLEALFRRVRSTRRR